METLEKYPDIIKIIKNLPISANTKSMLLKTKIMNTKLHGRKNAYVQCTNMEEQMVLVGNINLLIRSDIGRIILLHEISHIILDVYDNNIKNADLLSNFEIFEGEKDAWELTEVFLGRKVSFVKNAALNSYARRVLPLLCRH